MRTLLLSTLLGFLAVSLSGCFPVIAVGLGTGALMAADRRDNATYLMDEEIELKASHRIGDACKEGVHVNATSFNRRLLLTGEAGDASTRAKVAAIARKVPNVREVRDEIVVAPIRPFSARARDTFLSAKVKARFLHDPRFATYRIKVVTEAGSVYLMGMVTHEEGKAAAEIASTTRGVVKVIKVFEYLD